MNFAVFIPASMESKRLPGKPLLPIGDKTMLERVIERAKQTTASQVVVLSDSRLITEKVDQLDIVDIDGWVSTKPCRNGTVRCADNIQFTDSSIDLIVNWQVDEPFLRAKDVQAMVDMVAAWSPEEQAYTIGTIIGPRGGGACPHCLYGYKQTAWVSGPCTECYGGHSKHTVKVAHDLQDCCWFSRAPMPGAKNHVGVYCYHRSLLLKLAEVDQSYPGQQENLEQLDWLVAGYKIKAHTIWNVPRSINTHWDYEQVLKGFQS